MSYGELSGEKDRFFARLATLPGIKPRPSIGDWILIEVDSPAELAKKVNRRLEPGTVSVPRAMEGLVRVKVADPRVNQRLFETLQEVTKPVRRRRVV